MYLHHVGKLFVVSCLIVLAQICASTCLIAQSFDNKMNKAKQSGLTFLEQIDKLLALETDFKSAPKDTIGHLYYFIAYRFYKLADSENMIQYSSKAIDNYTLSSYTDYRLPVSYLMKGNAYRNLGLIKEAIKEYDAIIDMDIKGRGFETLYEAHWRKAQIYQDHGEIESSINYLNGFIESTQFDSVYNYGKATLYRELSIAYTRYSSDEKRRLALEALANADKVYANDEFRNNANLEQLVLNEMQRGLIAIGYENHELAIKHYEHSIELMQGYSSEDIFNNLVALCLLNICEELIQLGSCKKAQLAIEQANEIFLLHKNPRYIETHTEILTGMANAYACQGDMERSKEMFYNAKYDLVNEGSFKKLMKLRNFPHKKLLIDVLIEEFEHDVKRRTHDQFVNLKTTIYQIDSLIDFHLMDMYFESSMQLAKDEYLEFYQSAIDVAMELDDHVLYWFLTEKLNNLLLLINIQRDVESENQKELSSINSDIKKLSVRISQLDNELFFINPKTSTIDIDSIQQLLINNKATQLTLFNKRDQYINNNITNINGLDEIISTIESDETVIAYKFSSLRASAIVVNQNGTQLFDLGNKEVIISALRNWHADASNADDNIEAITSFNRLSNELYSLLIKPLGDLSNTITIIPDAELYYLNFEALLSDNDQYLINNHTISYELSGALYVRNAQPIKNDISSISAFIPSYSNGDLPALSNTNNGILALSELSGLHVYSDQETTKENFIAALDSSDILHFGGHAIKVDENNKYSHLALEASTNKARNIISLGDLYSLQTTTQLVALPACHSGSGDLIAGEGISNLSRGFFYAGAKSVISSIWEANDNASSIIMNSFYTYVLQGESKSVALRQAKLDYLKTAPEFLRHPKLWAGLTLTGDDRALYKQHLNPYLHYGLLGLLLLSGIFMFFKWRYS